MQKCFLDPVGYPLTGRNLLKDVSSFHHCTKMTQTGLSDWTKAHFDIEAAAPLLEKIAFL